MGLGSLSLGEILFILLIVGMMAVPSAVFAFFVWRKVYRRIARLEDQVEVTPDFDAATMRYPS